MKPLFLTEKRLIFILLPYIQDYPWALDTIGDLWRMGAPTPQRGPNNEEMRILLPTQFQKWWADVCQRSDLSITPEQVLRYA